MENIKLFFLPKSLELSFIITTFVLSVGNRDGSLESERVDSNLPYIF